jgi:hypothetical protein
MASSGADHGMQAAAMDNSRPRRTAARGGLRFDLDAWLAPLDLQPDETPSLSRELQMQSLVLPISPVDPIVAGASSQTYLQALLMDPAYQLK